MLRKLPTLLKSYLFCSILESAAVRRKIGVALRCENDVQDDALTVVYFTMLCVVFLHFTVGVTRLLLSSRALVSLVFSKLMPGSEKLHNNEPS